MQRFIQALLRLVKAQGDQGYQWPEQQGMASVRGVGDVSVLYGLNVVLAVDGSSSFTSVMRFYLSL